LGYERHEISLVITQNSTIKALNEKYRLVSRPTHVLAFPMGEGDFSAVTPVLLGHIVISAEKAEQEAAKAGITTEERLSQLLVHGILHLVGYDHEKGNIQAKEMEAKSLDLIRLIENNPELTAF